MKFVLHIDNGESYSDYTDWVVAVCDTKEQAEKAVSIFKEWKQNVLAEITSEDGVIEYPVPKEKCKEIRDRFPYPLPTEAFSLSMERYSITYLGNYSCWYVEVPEWAQ